MANSIETRVIKNASWLIVCKIIRSILVFVIGMLTARYLGPSNYGLISYAASVVAFFTPIMQLGLSATLVREFIETPERESQILGTSLVLNILSALTCVVSVTMFSIVANPGEPATTMVCFLYSLVLVMQASEMTQYWFQAKLLSKYPAIAALIAYAIGAVYKIHLLLSGKSVYWFALTHTIEALVIAVMLIGTYFRLGGKKLGFSFALGREMLSRSKYYIIAGMMMVVYQQTDKIMLKMMLDETATGFYSAALSCIGISGFVFSAILDSARPSILEGKQKSQATYENRIMMLFAVITGLSLLQSVGMSILAKPLIWVIYGEDYLPAASVLQISVWYVAFGYYGSVRNVWILAEEKQQYLWIIDLSGAICNVLCNWIMIPMWGACGAAIASLTTQMLINVVLCFFLREMRPCGVLMLKSFRIKRLIDIARGMRGRI